MKHLLILLAVFVTSALPVQAATKYVIDEITVTMRSGKGSQFQILRTLPSGTALEVLQTDNDSGYSLAKSVKSGVEGWVLTQYLSNQPIHRDRLATAMQRITKLEKENKSLKESASDTGRASSSMQKDIKSLTSDNEKMNKELIRIRDIAKRPMKIASENKNLKEESIKIDKEVNMLRQENQALKDRSTKEWFLAGAGILFFGIIFGLILPKFKSSRRSNYDSAL